MLRAANLTVKITGGLIFAWLTWYSLRYTHFCMPGIEERPLVMKDSVWKQVVFWALTVGIWIFLIFMEKRVSRNTAQLISGVSVIVAMVCVAAASFYWIGAADHVPVGDPAFVYGGASYFLEGNYMFLNTPAGYFAVYPHQLPLTALTELLFLLVGTYQYYAFECICAVLATAIVFVGYLILREATVSMAAAVMYCLTAMCCLPLIFYTSWVYGDLPSIFFALLAAWLLLRYCLTEKTGWLVGMVLAATMAMAVRKNSMILVVALCLVALVCLIVKKDKRLFAAAICAVLLPAAVYQGVYRLYEAQSGYEHSKGVPVITWVSMGLNENDGKYGWYDDSAKLIYIESGYDGELTRAAAKANIARRLAVFRADKSYAGLFFREKILSQWNEPLYQSVYFNTKFKEENMPAENSLVSKISNEYFPKVLAVCNRLQLFVYAGMLFYFLFAVKKDSDIRQQLLAIAVIGGFLFSILWEAKARYAFPYYVTMFPLAAVGYYQMLQTVASLGGKDRQQESEEDNIIPFRKSA